MYRHAQRHSVRRVEKLRRVNYAYNIQTHILTFNNLLWEAEVVEVMWILGIMQHHVIRFQQNSLGDFLLSWLSFCWKVTGSEDEDVHTVYTGVIKKPGTYTVQHPPPTHPPTISLYLSLSLCHSLNPTGRGWPVWSGSASRFLPVVSLLQPLSPSACSWEEMLGLSKYKMNQGVSFRPAQFGKCHTMTFVVNWRYTNKDGLIYCTAQIHAKKTGVCTGYGE